MTNLPSIIVATIGFLTVAAGLLAHLLDAVAVERLGFGSTSMPEGLIYLLLAATIARRSRVACAVAALLLLFDTSLLLYTIDVRHGRAALALIVARSAVAAALLWTLMYWKPVVRIRMVVPPLRDAAPQLTTPPAEAQIGRMHEPTQD